MLGTFQIIMMELLPQVKKRTPDFRDSSTKRPHG
jgi:hypothetical protein